MAGEKRTAKNGWKRVKMGKHKAVFDFNEANLYRQFTKIIYYFNNSLN